MLVLARHVLAGTVYTHHEWIAHGRACPCLERVRYCSDRSRYYSPRAGSPWPRVPLARSRSPIHGGVPPCPERVRHCSYRQCSYSLIGAVSGCMPLRLPAR